MESIIEGQSTKAEQLVEKLFGSWEEIKQILPEDLETSVETYKALRRRRGVASGGDLLRLIMGYCVLDKSLSEVGSWALLSGIADLSTPAIYERLTGASAWLGHILLQFLKESRVQLPTGRAVQLDIRDASVISRPGSQGTDWRVHLQLHLGEMVIDGVQLTDAKGGESLSRFPGEADRITLADRVHATRKGLAGIIQEGGSFVVRMAWQNLPLEDEQELRWPLVDWLQHAFRDPQTVVREQRVYLRYEQQRYAVRVCAVRLEKEAAEAAVKRARERSRKNGHTPDERTLFAAQFVFVITNLPSNDWDTQTVLALYRIRWQIELFFKRLKSILFLDHLRAKKPELAKTYLLGKLLAACLLDRLIHPFVHALPAGFSTLDRPLSYWSLTRLLWEQFQILIRGPLCLDQLNPNLEKLRRFLCSSPRKRHQQLAHALAFLAAAPLLPASLPTAPLS